MSEKLVIDGIGLTRKEGVDYRYNYWGIPDLIAKHGDIPVIREFILNDLFFCLYFIIRPFSDEASMDRVNSKFVVDRCWEIQTGPESYTLDVWARYHFKAIDINEPVPTKYGWKAHGDLKVGDIVFSPDGKETEVVYVTPIFRGRECYRVKFDDGYSVITDADHLWEIYKRSRKRIKGTKNKRKDKDILVVDTKTLYAHCHAPDKRYMVKLCKPVEYMEKSLPIHPYVFGCWLGDGTSENGCITISENELREKICSCGVEITEKPLGNDKNMYTIYNISSKLRSLGVLGNKHIPEIYLQASVEQRRELLQGLMDTDGYCDKRGTATFVNINEKLIDGFFELAASLGLKPRKRKHKGIYENKEYVFWHVSFQAYKDDAPFKLSRKLERCQNGSRRRPFKSIISVEKCESVPVSCIKVDREDGLYLIGKHFTPTHNTSIMAAEIVQYALKNPEHCQAILAFKAPVAKAMQFAVKQAFENIKLLPLCFPDVAWENPKKESPKWNDDEGLILKRKSNRREPSIGAYGLVEGMPTGLHFERRIYDDIVTQDMANSPSMLEDVKMKFDISQNLRTMTSDKHRVVGTFYNHMDPLVYIRDKEDIHGNKLYLFRKYPATEDGTPNGKPVLMSQEELDKLKKDRGFNCQQLCDPTPQYDMKLNPDYLKTNIDILPNKLYKFMVIDPAGDDNKRRDADSWAVLVVGVDPNVDDIGASNIYILDAFISTAEHSEVIDIICKMYMRAGIVHRLGVERTNIGTTDLHIQNALKRYGRHISEESGTLMKLRHANREKTARILSALQWPLNNGKIHVSSKVSPVYVDRLKYEMAKFPYWHDDGIDALAYVYDIMREYHFGKRSDEKAKKFAVSGLSHRRW